MAGHGGKRPGAGRPRGSRNKATIARMSAAEILGVEDRDLLPSAVHQRGHALLLEMERLAIDPSQPAGVRIMAARTALPFLVSRLATSANDTSFGADIVAAIDEGRERLRTLRGPVEEAALAEKERTE